MRFKKFLLWVIPLCMAYSLPVAAKDMTLSTGIDYSSGTYGATQSTDIIYLPITVKYEKPSWSLKLTLPYIKMTSPDNTINSGTPVQTASTVSLVRQTFSGQGDIIVTGTHNLHHDLAHGFAIDLTGKIKIPTADTTQGLGTGKYDYSAQLDLLKQSGRHMLFSSVGYRKMGDPDGLDFKNPWYGSIGWGHTASNTIQWGGIYELQQPVIDGNALLKDVLAYITYKITATHTVQGYLVKGLSDGSPDWGSGISVSTSF